MVLGGNETKYRKSDIEVIGCQSFDDYQSPNVNYPIFMVVIEFGGGGQEIHVTLHR